MKMKAKIIRLKVASIVFLALIAVACILMLGLAGLLASAWIVLPILSLLVNESELPTTQFAISASYPIVFRSKSGLGGDNYGEEGIAGTLDWSPFLAIRIVGNKSNNGSPEEIRSNYGKEFSEMCASEPRGLRYDEQNSTSYRPAFYPEDLKGDNVIIVVPKDERLPPEAEKSRVFYRSFGRNDESATPCDGQKYTIDFENCDILEE